LCRLWGSHVHPDEHPIGHNKRWGVPLGLEQFPPELFAVINAVRDSGLDPLFTTPVSTALDRP
jgi:hypothetical protein